MIILEDRTQGGTLNQKINVGDEIVEESFDIAPSLNFEGNTYLESQVNKLWPGLFYTDLPGLKDLASATTTVIRETISRTNVWFEMAFSYSVWISIHPS